MDPDYAEFCAAMFPRLRGVLFARVGDLAIAEELAQEALMRLCTRWDRLGAHDDRVRWIYRVAINLANSWFRRRLAERRAMSRVHPSAESAAGPGEQVPIEMLVRAAAAQLPDRQREVVALRFYADLSVETVAAIMKCAPGTVKSLTARATESLRHLLPDSNLEEVDR